MRIAVTGGNGDIGSHLIPYLTARGHTVRSIDRVFPNPAPPIMPDFYQLDVTDFGQLVAALSGCEAVVHLAAHRTPLNHPAPVVYGNNTVGSYNILHAAAILGINRVCLASSVNAIGAAFSRAPQYDFFPINETHPTKAEDPYSLSKWVAEEQANAFARRYESMQIASLRFHWVLDDREIAIAMNKTIPDIAINHLWAYTKTAEASRAIELALTTEFSGHEVFYIVAPTLATEDPAERLAETHYPDVPLRSEIKGRSGFYDCSKAGRLLGWTHVEE